MRTLMNPIPGDANAQYAWLYNHPAAPKLQNPTDDQLAQLDGYWLGVFNQRKMLAAIHEYEPGYMPGFSLITL